MGKGSMKADSRFLKVLRREEQIDRRKRKREINKRFRRSATPSNGCAYKKVANRFESLS